MTIYAIPNYECNLSCPHCDIHTQHVNYDEDRFLEMLKKLSNDATNSITLFGGEPTLHKDRFKNIIKLGIPLSISTNLIVEDAEILEILLTANLKIATSWNMSRFNDQQLSLWLRNLSRFSTAAKKCIVLITMTPDLVYSPLNSILDILEQISKTNGVESILFEHLISNQTTEKFHQDCDQWLCAIHDEWKWPSLTNRIEEKVLSNNWKFNCSSTFTLLPDGKLQNGCPQKTNSCICLECLSCKNAINCQPCSLQRFCTFPKKLYAKLHEKS